MEKTCDNCVYFDVGLTEEPCVDCDGPNCRFEQKEEGMTSDPQMELEVARRRIQEKDEMIKGLERVLASKDGMIDGLKFAVRCNGVSGGEVR